eukprot:Rmarinus@m.28218
MLLVFALTLMMTLFFLVSGTSAGVVTIAVSNQELLTYEEGHGGTNLFFALFSIDGEVQWVRQFGGSGSDGVHDCLFDDDGGFYSTGYFSEGAADFGGTTVEALYLDLFVAKYHVSLPTNRTQVEDQSEDSAEFSLQWLLTGGGAYLDKGTSLGLDAAAGVVYVGGLFRSDTLQFNLHGSGDTLEMEGGGTYNADVALIAVNVKDGSIIWYTEGHGVDDDQINSIVVQETGQSVHIYGFFSTLLQFTDTSGSAMSALSADGYSGFHVRFTQHGVFESASILDVVAASGEAAADGLGVLVYGQSAEGSFLNSIEIPTGGGSDGFLARMTWGGEVEWIMSIAGGGEDFVSSTTSLLYDSVDLCLSVGFFTGLQADGVHLTLKNDVFETALLDLNSPSLVDFYVMSFDCGSGRLRYLLQGDDRGYSVDMEQHTTYSGCSCRMWPDSPFNDTAYPPYDWCWDVFGDGNRWCYLSDECLHSGQYRYDWETCNRRPGYGVFVRVSAASTVATADGMPYFANPDRQNSHTDILAGFFGIPYSHMQVFAVSTDGMTMDTVAFMEEDLVAGAVDAASALTLPEMSLLLGYDVTFALVQEYDPLESIPFVYPQEDDSYCFQEVDINHETQAVWAALLISAVVGVMSLGFVFVSWKWPPIVERDPRLLVIAIVGAAVWIYATVVSNEHAALWASARHCDTDLWTKWLRRTCGYALWSTALTMRMEWCRRMYISNKPAPSLIGHVVVRMGLWVTATCLDDFGGTSVMVTVLLGLTFGEAAVKSALALRAMVVTEDYGKNLIILLLATALQMWVEEEYVAENDQPTRDLRCFLSLAVIGLLTSHVAGVIWRPVRAKMMKDEEYVESFQYIKQHKVHPNEKERLVSHQAHIQPSVPQRAGLLGRFTPYRFSPKMFTPTKVSKLFSSNDVQRFELETVRETPPPATGTLA